MGGEGSGRKPDIFNMITRQEDKVPIGNEIILPNYSGLREGAKKTDTEVMATRTYVDSQIAGENHWDMDLGQTVIYPHLGGINVSGSKCYWTDAYSTKLFVNTNTLTVSGSNVGIGTTGPGAKLSIVAPTGTNVLTLQAGSNASAYWQIGQNAGGGTNDDTFSIYSGTYGPSHNYAPVMTANNAGNVGIGTTNPLHKLDVNGSFYSELVVKGNCTGAVTIDWNAGNTQHCVLTGNVTFTFSNGQSGGSYKLVLKQGGTGSYTVTWPASVRWGSGVAPTLTTTVGKTDYAGFFYNGVDSTYDGNAFNANF